MEPLLLSLMNAYEALGLPADCSFTDVTKVYRRLAKRFHPDSNPHDPASSQEVMTRINAAYSTIKECHENGVMLPGVRAAEGSRPGRDGATAGSEGYQAGERRHGSGIDRTLWAWIERTERERRKEEERRRKERERIERERAASRRMWEKLALQRKLEIKDKKTYEVIVRYAQKLISFYYRMNFQNPQLRDRPHVKENFLGYVEIYRQRLKRIGALKRSSESPLYRRKSSQVYEFLKTFINDSLKPHSPFAERRASALDVYQRAARYSEKFVRAYFSDEEMAEKRALEFFKKSLDHFDEFLRSFPESPLVEYACRKVEILDRMYRGFLKEA